MNFGPGVSVPAYLPRRSFTQACCCGTILTARAMKITAMTKRMMAISMRFFFLCRVRR